MTGSVAVDVAIGLAFIFLLYSLLATTIAELIATFFGYRARTLRTAISRMLENSEFDKPEGSGIKNYFLNFFRDHWDRVWNKVKFWDLDKNKLYHAFYSQPSIKYLTPNRFFSKPSYISPQNFSKAILDLMKKEGANEDNDLIKIQKALGILEYKIVAEARKHIVSIREDAKKNLDTFKDKLKPWFDDNEHNNKKFIAEMRNHIESLPDDAKNFIEKLEQWFDDYKIIFLGETRDHITSLLNDAQNDLVKFRTYLEQWFDDTMERATGWYKRKMQFVLLIIGLGLAFSFNADTIDMVKKLSKDNEAREQLLAMASSYLQENKQLIINKGSLQDSTQAKLDSLLKIREEINKDIEDANSLLGTGWSIPDSILISRDSTLISNDSTLIFRDSTLISRDSILISRDSTLISRDSTLISNDSTLNFRDSTLISRDSIISYQKATIFYKKYWLFPWFMKEKIEVWLEIPDHINTVYLKKSLKTIITCDINKVDYIHVSSFRYIFLSVFNNPWGYLLTALAISLGAPFWFDLLNKLIRLRTSVPKKTPDRPSNQIASKTDSKNEDVIPASQRHG